jgi:hypothetical protein
MDRCVRERTVRANDAAAYEPGYGSWRTEKKTMVAPALITTRADFAEHLRGALRRLAEVTGSSGYEVSGAIAQQLENMQSAIIEGRMPTEDEKAKITVGPLAVRNLDETDWELSRVLQELDYAFRRYELLPD